MRPRSRCSLGLLMGVALGLLCGVRASDGAGCVQSALIASTASLRCGASANIGVVATEVSVDRHLRRWMTRTERLAGRVLRAAGGIFAVVLWLVASSVLFFVVAAGGAAAEGVVVKRLVSDTPGALLSLWLGVQVFAGAVRSSGLLLGPRLILGLGWFYWLIPFDLFAEEGVLLSYMDDVLVAVGSGKLFLILCPQVVLEEQAEELLRRRGALSGK